MRVTDDCVLVQDQEPQAAALEDGIVLLSIRAGSYFGFNRVASEIWAMLNEPRRAGDIFGALAQCHAVDQETVVRDVTPFLETLIVHRLVRISDPGQAP